MPKRTSGEGTIYKTERGKYRAQIVVGGRRLSKTAASAKECRTWLKQQGLLADQFHSHSYDEMTLNELIDTWLASTKTTVRSLTHQHYSSRINNHVRPALGSMAVVGITPVQIQAVIDDLIASERWTNHIRCAFTDLKIILNRATTLGAIQFNPMDRVFMPICSDKSDDQNLHVWNKDQVHEYTSAADAIGLRQVNSLKFAVGTGIRVGELLGLTWENVDLEKQEISIIQQAVPVRGDQVAGLGPLKNKASKRNLKIGQYLINVLLDQKEANALDMSIRGDKWVDYGLVFPNRLGFIYTRNTMRHAHRKAIAEAGLPVIRFHDLRHTAISLMLQANVPITEVSRYAGHSNVGVTMRTYSHFIPSEKSHAAIAMDKVFN